jgi:cytochrome P450
VSPGRSNRPLTFPGPVVRTTPKTVSFTSPTALQQIYGTRKAFKKSLYYDGIRKAEGGGATTFTAVDESTHEIKRRLLSYAFSEKSMRDYEPYVSHNINKWLDVLGDGSLSSTGWTTPKNVATWINYLTFDIITDLAYGKSFDLLGKEDMRFASELVPKGAFAAYVVSPCLSNLGRQTDHLVDWLPSFDTIHELASVPNSGRIHFRIPPRQWHVETGSY